MDFTQSRVINSPRPCWFMNAESRCLSSGPDEHVVCLSARGRVLVCNAVKSKRSTGYINQYKKTRSEKSAVKLERWGGGNDVMWFHCCSRLSPATPGRRQRKNVSAYFEVFDKSPRRAWRHTTNAVNLPSSSRLNVPKLGDLIKKLWRRILLVLDQFHHSTELVSWLGLRKQKRTNYD